MLFGNSKLNVLKGIFSRCFLRYIKNLDPLDKISDSQYDFRQQANDNR